MAHEDGSREELLRQFDAAISGLELSDLRGLVGGLPGSTDPAAEAAVRPELRRPARSDPVVYRIRVDLDHAEPPIWRRLDVRSDLTLDVVHQVMQAAYRWADSHPHRFSLGGGPFDRTSQLFLCPFDVAEGEEDGLPATDVRLDEVMQQPGDVVRYVYDYGDHWELILRVEDVLPAGPDTPTASCVDGQRSAPPEDSGGVTDAESLAGVLSDPAHFDTADVNQALRDPYFLIGESGLHRDLLDLVKRLAFTKAAPDLARRILRLAEPADGPSTAAITVSLAPVQWFLDRADGEGIELTSAGYLKPADVEAACAVVPVMADWFGKRNRETHCQPLMRFRRSLQTVGLLRKHRGRLLLTRAGAAARRDPAALWDHLAARLAPGGKDQFEQQAALLLLAYAATSDDGTVPFDRIAEDLHNLGWQHSDGEPVAYYDLYHFEPNPWDLLGNVSDQPVMLGDLHRQLSPEAMALARAALRNQRGR